MHVHSFVCEAAAARLVGEETPSLGRLESQKREDGFDEVVYTRSGTAGVCAVGRKTLQGRREGTVESC